MGTVKAGARLRWGKFYWSDWTADEKLRLCSLAARGLWVELLCLAARNDGYVLINGKAPTLAQLQRLMGEPVDHLVHELLEMGVMRVARGGIWYSKRLIEEKRKHDTASESGKLGMAVRLEKAKGNSSVLQGSLQLETERELEVEEEASVTGTPAESGPDLPHQNPNAATPPKPPEGGAGGKGADNDQTKPARKASEATQEQRWVFDQFYAAYPRKEAPAAALRALVGQWKHIGGLTKEEKLHTLGDGLRGYIRKIRTQKLPPEKIAHPATWLNGHRWLDEPLKPVDPGPPKVKLAV